MNSKTCACCKKHYEEIPKEAILHLDCLGPGHYFNCECGSTMLWPLKSEDKNEASKKDKIISVK